MPDKYLQSLVQGFPTSGTRTTGGTRKLSEWYARCITEMSYYRTQRRITEMSTDVKEQIITEVHGSKYGFAIQLDESTNVKKLRTASGLCALCY